MKSLLKRLLALARVCLSRMPDGIPTGHFLERDLRIVLGDKTGLVCIDAGAHHGEFTASLLATLRAPQIHAFEPAPDNFARLRTRHGTATGVNLVEAGLSDTPGHLPLHTFDNSTLNSFLPLAKEGHATFDRPGAGQTPVARLLRLDDYAKERGIERIDLLKIDTQGYELPVLRGAADLLRAGRVGSVLLELNFTPLYQGQSLPHEIIAHLRDHDLHLVEFYEKCRHPPFLSWCTALFTRRPASS